MLSIAAVFLGLTLVRMASSVGCQTKVLIVRDGPTTLPISHREDASVDVYTPAQIKDGGFSVL